MTALTRRTVIPRSRLKGASRREQVESHMARSPSPRRRGLVLCASLPRCGAFVQGSRTPPAHGGNTPTKSAVCWVGYHGDYQISRFPARTRAIPTTGRGDRPKPSLTTHCSPAGALSALGWSRSGRFGRIPAACANDGLPGARPTGGVREPQHRHARHLDRSPVRSRPSRCRNRRSSFDP